MAGKLRPFGRTVCGGNARRSGPVRVMAVRAGGLRAQILFPGLPGRLSALLLTVRPVVTIIVVVPGIAVKIIIPICAVPTAIPAAAPIPPVVVVIMADARGATYDYTYGRDEKIIFFHCSVSLLTRMGGPTPRLLKGCRDCPKPVRRSIAHNSPHRKIEKPPRADTV